MKVKIALFKSEKIEFLEVFWKAFRILIIFLIPLYFAYLYPGYNMFEMGKSALFGLLMSGFFLFFSFWFIQKNRASLVFKIVFKNKEGKKYIWIVLALLLGLIILTPFSLNPLQSFFGSYDRQAGLLSYLFYFLWFFLVFLSLVSVKVLKGKNAFYKDLNSLLLALNLSGLLVSVYAILQIINIDFFTWPEAPYLTGRALSTLGQPNFLASFLLLCIPLAFYLAFKAKNLKARIFLWFIFLLEFLALFFTASRGAFIALIIILIVFLIILLQQRSIKWKTKVIVISFTLLTLFLGALTFETLNPGRIRSMLDLRGGSLAARVFFFTSAADAISNRPLLGYGLETGKGVFIKYYERDWGIYGDVGSNTDRAHNIVLDTLLSLGFLGLLLFSLFYYSFLKLSYREYRQGKPLALALGLGGLGYLSSLLFSFTIVAGEVYFFLFFALLLAISYEDFNSDFLNTFEKEVKVVKLEFKIILSILIFLLSFFSSRFFLSEIKADNYLNRMYDEINDLEFIPASLTYLQIEDLNTNPIIQAKAQSMLANNLSNYCNYNSFNDLASEFIIKKKLTYLSTVLNENDYINIFIKAKIFSCLHETELADAYFSRFSSLSPNWPLNYLEWGLHYLRLGNTELAEKYFQIAEINLPDINSQYINEEHRLAVLVYKYMMYNSLAQVYQGQGSYSRALLFYESSYRAMPGDYTILKKIADNYYLLDNLDLAIKYNLRGYQANPSDFNWPLALGILYTEKSNLNLANTYLSLALDLAPAGKQEEIRALMVK